MRELCPCFLCKKKPAEVSQNHFCILYFIPLHCGLLFRSRTIFAPAFLSLRNAIFFASLFAGFYFLFTSAFNFGPMFTLASDRATRYRSFSMYVHTRPEAEIPTRNDIWIEIFKRSLGPILWTVWADVSSVLHNFSSYQTQNWRATCIECIMRKIKLERK